MMMSKLQLIVSWTLQLVVAGILLQTLLFKFTGAEESRWIFTTLGVEPWGRILSGVVELVAAAFEPGSGFIDQDSAYLGKIQLRYRF